MFGRLTYLILISLVLTTQGLLLPSKVLAQDIYDQSAECSAYYHTKAGVSNEISVSSVVSHKVSIRKSAANLRDQAVINAITSYNLTRATSLDPSALTYAKYIQNVKSLYSIEPSNSAPEICDEMAREYSARIPIRAIPIINEKVYKELMDWVASSWDTQSSSECVALFSKSADVFTNLALSRQVPLDEAYSKVSSDLIRMYSLKALTVKHSYKHHSAPSQSSHGSMSPRDLSAIDYSQYSSQFDVNSATISELLAKASTNPINGDVVSARYSQCISFYDEVSSLLSPTDISDLNSLVQKKLVIRFSAFK